MRGVTSLRVGDERRARFELRVGFARSLRNIVGVIGLDLYVSLGNLSALDEAFP